MNNNENVNIFDDKSKNLFEQRDDEKKKEDNSDNLDDEFIKSLPEWDLPPLYERVRRVNRQ